MKRTRARGFSLLELLVVMGIAALISSLVLGAFATMQSNSRRTTCQSNMAQIYRALRLYVEDDSNPPPHSDPTRTDDGLWLLWGFRDPNNAGKIVPPRSAAISIQGYLRTDSSLHCPEDDRADSVLDPTTGAVAPLYLSYQVADPDLTSANAADVQTYFPTRTTTVSDADYLRQLVHQRTLPGSATSTPYIIEDPTPATTIVTWCPYHRLLGSGRADNILFYDGTVKRMPTTQTCGTTDLQGWHRLPDCSTEGQSNPTPTATP